MSKQLDIIEISNNDSEEILIEEGTIYREADIPNEDEDEPIGKPIITGNEFDKESRKLRSVVGSLRDRIWEIRSSAGFTSKYAVVRGGDDGTEMAQLQSAKAASSFAYREIESIEEMINCPYRYRVDFRENGKVNTYYLGPVEQLNLNDGNQIYSYHSDFGRKLSRYDPNNTYLNDNIFLRREFDIRSSYLRNYKNIAGTVSKNRTFIKGITDPFLMDVFKMRRADHQLRDIILTIQDNQNEIVYLPSYRNLIVQGCAGSGKTMVMMHRLSRLQNWEHSFDPREILIITPSDQYKLYMKALTEGLAISKITQLTMENLYQELLLEYGKDFHFKGTLAKEDGVNEEYLHYIYSDKFKREFSIEIIAVLRGRTKLVNEIKSIYVNKKISFPYEFDMERHDFSEYVDMLLKRLREKLTVIDDAPIKMKYGQLERLWAHEEQIKSIFIPACVETYSTVLRKSVGNVKKKIEMLLDYLEPEKEVIARKLLKYEYIEQSNEEIHNYLNNVSQIVLSASDEVKKCDKALKEIENLQMELNNIPLKIEELLAVIEQLEAENDNSALLENLNVIAERAKQYTDIQIFRRAYAGVTEPELNKLNMKRPPRTHRYDLYVRLLFCNQYYNKKVPMYKFICVDEGQDLAVNEYALLHDISDNRFTINIYGDTNQTLSPGRGIRDWGVLRSVFYGDYYTLNENYRNSNQITRFCNNEFNMDVKEIGIDGPKVNCVNSKDFIERIKSIKSLCDRRHAIIIPRSVNKKSFMKKIDNSLISCDTISRKTISLLYLDEAKGFEFDVVYLWDENMEKNQRYVAMTRAIEELFIMK